MDQSTLQLRPYQRLAVDDAVRWFATAAPGDRRLYAAPTGTGKSVVELHLQDALGEGTWIVTPRVEIIEGMLTKMGVVASTDVVEDGFAHRITTPIRLRNALARCSVHRPHRLIVDEVHHHSATSYQELDILCDDAPSVGFTATPYRGTPRGTAKLREQWGDPVWILTYPEAAAAGVLSVPTCRVVPLVDDDVISVSAGEFVIASASEVVGSRLSEAAQMTVDLPIRPTLVAVPSVETCELLAAEIRRLGRPAYAVTGSTPLDDRRAAFAACVAGEAILVNVNVVSEGVDLPIRRLIDLRPTLSPVYWLQMVGRITRPTDTPPEYICCCRNLERHCYLLAGCVPSATIRDAQTAFETPSKSSGMRSVGLEAVGRFKAAELPLADGTRGQMYCVQRVEGSAVAQFACLVHPGAADPVWAKRTNEDGRYGRWRQCEAPDISDGFASVSASTCTDKQLSWWRSSASRHGLDATVTPNRRQFAALPVLADLKVKLKI